MSATHTCPVCSGLEATDFESFRDMPVSIGIQWPTREEAVNCGKGDLDLVCCPGCGFIWNRSFDADLLEYSQRYDNSLDFSPVFQEFATNLARRLIDSYGIRNKTIVELGCGKGHFLNLLCEEGENRGVGFDPSFEGERVRTSASDRITYFQDFYGEKYTSHRGDLVCCRHVFEHIENPLDFLAMVRRTIGDNPETIVYFEVPNVRFILEKLSVWDVIFEHCNYFSAESLRYVFQRAGFEVLSLDDAYGGQFLSLEAKLADPGVQNQGRNGVDPSALCARAREFSGHVRETAAQWAERLAQFSAAGKRAVVWGGGAKTVSFLNMLPDSSPIGCVVDINPNKQGLFIPGSGQEIVSPEFLTNYKPDLVILMNPIYQDEVQAQLLQLGLDPELIAS